MGLDLVTDNYPIHAAFLMQMLEAMKGNGVYTGLAVTQQTVANDTVKVAAGRFAQGGTILDSVGSASLSFSAADATNPRIDIVVARTSIVAPYLAVVAGTATANPVPATIPANAIVIAYVYITPTGAAPVISDTNAGGAYIIDGRQYCPVKLGTGTITTGNSNVTVFDASVTANSKIFLTLTTTLTSRSTLTVSSPLTPGLNVGFTGTAFTSGVPGAATTNALGIQLYWGNVSAGTSFQVNLPSTALANVSFDYMIVG